MFGGEKFGGAKIHYEFSYMEFPQWISVWMAKIPPPKKNWENLKKSIEIPSWVRVVFQFAISCFRP